jgi:hypothetical protein
MAKTLNLGLGQAALIDGEFVGKIVSAEYADATPTETVAVEISPVTSELNMVPIENVLNLGGFVFFTNNNSVVEI